jgi:hypothetical protein
MLRRYFLLFSVSVLLLSSLESCFMQKNKCDACPGVAKQKKVRRHSKGSL